MKAITPREKKLLELYKLTRELRDLTEEYDRGVLKIQHEIEKMHPDYPNTGIGISGVSAPDNLDSVGHVQYVSAKLKIVTQNLDRLLASIENEYN
jgi:hypothetical protein